MIFVDVFVVAVDPFVVEALGAWIVLWVSAEEALVMEGAEAETLDTTEDTIERSTASRNECQFRISQ